MAINIQNIIAALEAKVAAATSATETQELIVLIKTIKASGQQTIVTYATASSLPTASADNTGNIGYVADVGKLYYSNGTTWAEIGSGSSGGGGTAYDQSLNTTDDVIFNSALIGDVSVVGNVLGAVDAYGNKETLVVDNALTVKAATTSVTQQIVFDNKTVSYNPYDSSGKKLTFDSQWYGWSAENIDRLASIVPGTLVNFTLGSTYGLSTGTFTVNQAQKYINYYGNPYVEMIIENVAATNDGWAYVSQDVSNITFSWATQVSTPVDVLSADSTGVNVNGTFTVNGQPITGGSSGGGGTAYDQSLNTTDDVVFNSALVGDVSIVGNTLAAVDAYGNSDTLELSVPVAFTKTETITSGSETTINYADTSMFGNSVLSPVYDYGTYQQYVRIRNDSGFNPTVALQLTSIPSGTLVRTNGLYSYGTYETKYFRFTVNSINTISDPYNPSVITQVRYSVASLEYSPDGTNWYQQSFDNNNWYSSTMTSTGVLTYDDFTSETTTKSSTLTINNNSQLKIDSNVLVEIDNSITKSVDISNMQVYYTGGDHIEIPVYGISLEEKNDLLSLKNGDIITSTSVYLAYNGVTYNTFTGSVSLVQIVDDMYGNPNVWVYGNFTVDGSPLENQRYYTFQNPWTWIIPNFTKVLETNNNQVIIPALTATDVNATDIVADSALIGDVSIIGNTISGVDAYGLADKLVVDGDLEVTGDLTSPTDLNVTVGGGISSTTISSYTGTSSANWSGTTFEFPNDIDLSTAALLQSMQPGSRIKFTNYMYGTFDIKTISTVIITGTGQYQFIVDTDTNSFGYGAIGGTSVNDITIEQTSEIVTYGFNTKGVLSTSKISDFTTDSKESEVEIRLGSMTDNTKTKSISWYPNNGSNLNYYSGRAENFAYGTTYAPNDMYYPMALTSTGSYYLNSMNNLYYNQAGESLTIDDGALLFFNNRVVYIESVVIAKSSTGDNKVWKLSGAFQSVGGTVSPLANVNKTVVGYHDNSGVTYADNAVASWDVEYNIVQVNDLGIPRNILLINCLPLSQAAIQAGVNVGFSVSHSITYVSHPNLSENAGGGGGK